MKRQTPMTNMNAKYKLGISNVKPAADVAGSDYGSFSLQVIVNSPGQNDDGVILENFDNSLTHSNANTHLFNNSIFNYRSN